jgi:hypothetical protein
MGVGALIGAGISAVGSIAGSAIGGAMSGGGGGGSSGAEAGTLKRARQIYIDPYTNAQYWNMDIPGMAQQSLNFGIQQAPSVNQASMQQLQALLGTALPGYQQQVGQMQTGAMNLLGGPITQDLLGPTTQQMLAGNVPADVQNQIQRIAAQQAISGGTAGAGTGTSGTITARDLGLTSLNIMQQGQQRAAAGQSMETAGFTQGSNLLQLARNYLMPQPVNPMTLLPLSDLVQGGEWMKEAQYQANLAGYTAAANQAGAMIAPPTPSPLPGIIGSVTGAAQSQGGQNLLSALFGGMGGGAGDTSAAGAVSASGGLFDTLATFA